MGGLARNIARLKKYMSSLVLFPLRPKGAERRDKEKMITYLVQERQAKERMARSYNFLKEAYPYKNKKKVCSTVTLRGARLQRRGHAQERVEHQETPLYVEAQRHE